MPVPVYAWAAVVLFVARVLHLRLAFAAPGATLIIPVPLLMLAGLGTAIAVVLFLAVRALVRDGLRLRPVAT